MFVTRDEIRNTVKKVITDNINNDIVFIIANKGFGKYKLLKEINYCKYQESIIVTNGDKFHSSSIIKNCLLHGIYEYLKRNNKPQLRKFLIKIIQKKERRITFSKRITARYHIILNTSELEDILNSFSVEELIDIYVTFTNNLPLVFFLRGPELSDSDKAYLCKLKKEIDTVKFTYIIALRPDTKGRDFIKDITQNRDERIWICPLIPNVGKESNDKEIVNIPPVNLMDDEQSKFYDDFKNEISKKNYYNPVFELVDDLLHSGINPSMIFTVANQEISKNDFDYINFLSVRLLDEPKASPYNNALVAHNGKFMWVDALVYYFFVSEGKKDLTLEIQRFYFAFIVSTNKWRNSSNQLHSLKVEIKKNEQKKMSEFLKKMSQISDNPIIPEISSYTARLSDWIRVFSRPTVTRKEYLGNIDSLVDELEKLCDGFSEISIKALQIISNETGRLGALDIALNITGKRLLDNSTLADKEIMEINELIKTCFEAMLRWNDLTMADEICDVLYLLQQQGMLDNYFMPDVYKNRSVYKYLSECMKSQNLDIGEIIMGKTTIFISYTEADNIVVDIIDKYLLSCGYDVKRYTRDIKDYESIDEFMKQIRKQDFVVPIVSDTYLRRGNCIYEITQLLKDDDYAKRTLPVVIQLPQNEQRQYSFFDTQYRTEIISFWETKAKNLCELISSLAAENRAELDNEYRKIKNYAQEVSKFLDRYKLNLVSTIPANTTPRKIKNQALKAAETIDDKIRDININ